MINWGMVLSLFLVFLCPVFLAAASFYPKGKDGHYRLEEWTDLETETLRKAFRRIGWGCLVVGLLLGAGFRMIFR